MATSPGIPTGPSDDARPGTDDGSVSPAGGAPGADRTAEAVRDIGEVPAIEVVTTAALHLMSAAAVKVGLSEDEETAGHRDLDEARKIIIALAGLVTAAAPEVGSQHARLLRDGLRQVQLAFREASPVPDALGQGPGERLTGPVT